MTSDLLAPTSPDEAHKCKRHTMSTQGCRDEDRKCRGWGAAQSGCCVTVDLATDLRQQGDRKRTGTD